MKIQSVVFLTAVLIFTTLVAETECFTAPVPNGKREYQKKVWKCLLIKLIPVQVSSKRQACPIHPQCNDPLKANSVRSIRTDR